MTELMEDGADGWGDGGLIGIKLDWIGLSDGVFSQKDIKSEIASVEGKGKRQ